MKNTSACYSNEDIWVAIHSDDQIGWHDRYRDIMKQLVCPQKPLWQLFRNYDEKLLEMNFIVVKATSSAMKTIALATKELFCVWPNYPYASAWKRSGQLYLLPPVIDESREWPFSVWDGEGLEYDYWCDTFFLPNTIDENLLSKTFSCDWLFKEQWANFSSTQFSDATSRITALLNDVPWIGISLFIYEPVYYVHFCSKLDNANFHYIMEMLKKNDINFGFLTENKNGVSWHENGSLNLW